MRVSREERQKTHERILHQTARLIRERGIDSTGVAVLMQEAGLTHGGFYGHFSSKDDLMSRACATAMAEKAALWREERQFDPSSPMHSAASAYLTAQHRDEPGSGCPLACLAGDMPRQSVEVREAFTLGFQEFIDIFSAKQPNAPGGEARSQSIACWVTLVGALVLSRAVNDETLSDEILTVAREFLRDR